EFGQRAHADFARAFVVVAGRNVQVLKLQPLHDLAGAQAERVDAGAIQLHADFAPGAALDVHRGYTFDLLERGPEHVVGVVAQLGQRAAATQRVGQDG